MAYNDYPTPQVLTPALSCSPHTWSECVANFCCLGDDDLERVIAYLLNEATRLAGSSAQTILAAAQAEGVLPPSFTNHDYLVALACIGASLASNSNGGVDIFKAAQAAGYGKVSLDQIRILTLIAVCTLTATQEN